MYRLKTLLLFYSSVFFIPITVLSLNTFCIFSTHTSILFIYASILFLRFWIIFTIITLNSFSGRLPMSSPFVWSCWFFTMLLHLLCFSVFSFCLINVFGVSFPPLARLQVPFTCEVCSPGWGWTSVLWRLPGRGETGACFLVSGSRSCLAEGQCHIQWCVWSVCELGMAFGSSGTGACWPWVGLGVSSKMEAFERALTD